LGDPAKTAGTREKIVSCYVVERISSDLQDMQTDKLRGLFEKYTGKKVPAKVSN